jgi:Trpc4-associated protein
MFANRKNQLGRYLQALKDEKEGMLEVNGSVQFMTNFRDLLLFWQDHYLHKDKDCSALEKVRIIFTFKRKMLTCI